MCAAFLVHPQQFLNDFKGRSKVWPKGTKRSSNRCSRRILWTLRRPRARRQHLRGRKRRRIWKIPKRKGWLRRWKAAIFDDEDSDFDPDEHSESDSEDEEDNYSIYDDDVVESDDDLIDEGGDDEDALILQDTVKWSTCKPTYCSPARRRRLEGVFDAQGRRLQKTVRN